MLGVFVLLLAARAASLDAPADVIVVGVGAASSVLLARLVPAHPHVNFVAIEAGDVVSAHLGATEPRSPSFADLPLTSVDIPGEYNNMAWHPEFEKFRQSNVDWAWQGKGFGGSGSFNGAWYQEPSDATFSSWPAGWQAGDMRPYFERGRQWCNITETPSMNKQHYASSAYHYCEPAAKEMGAVHKDTSHLPSQAPAVYGAPTVATAGSAERCLPTAALRTIMSSGGVSLFSNLKIIRNAVVNRVAFNGAGAPTTVLYESATGPGSVSLSSSGRVILSAGALFSSAILYRSGVGPPSRQSVVFPSGPAFTFANEGLGKLHDHVGTSVAVSCADYNGFDSLDHGAEDDLLYVSDRSGPYAQFGPIFSMFGPSSSGQMDQEIFVNPWGLGITKNAVWHNSSTFGVYAVNLKPVASDNVVVKDGKVQAPQLYFPMTEAGKIDLQRTAAFLRDFLTSLLAMNPQCSIAFGPSAPPFENLRISSAEDVATYMASDAYNGLVFTRLGMNHFVGSTPLSEDAAVGLEPSTLEVKGLQRVHVVDAGTIPASINAHLMGTVVAVAEKASDIIAGLLN